MPSLARTRLFEATVWYLIKKVLQQGISEYLASLVNVVNKLVTEL